MKSAIRNPHSAILVPPTQVRPEDELILHCAQMQDSADSGEQLRVLLGKDIEWPYLRRRALWHGMVPFLYHKVRDVRSEEAPETFLNQLEKQYLMSARRNVLMTGELLILVNLFEAHNIPVIPYKGPALAVMAYKDCMLREFDDLDILVRREDISRAKNLLIKQGYRPYLPLRGVQEKAYFGTSLQDSFPFTRANGLGPIDLHWTVEPECLSFVLKSEKLWQRLEKVTLDGFSIQTICPEDMVLLLCIHGTRHRWERLIWLRDLAGLIELHPEIKWQTVMDRANLMGARRMVSLSLLLSNSLLKAPLPTGVLPMLEKEDGIPRLMEKVQKDFFREIQGESLPFESGLYYFRAMERISDKARYCFGELATPTPLEWASLRLPSYLFPLYYTVRPVRLLGKYGLKLLKQIPHLTMAKSIGHRA